MQNDHHDQSTVTSPTGDQLHEKNTGPQANGVGDGYTPKTGLAKFTTNFIFQVVLRVLQFINSVTLLGLASASLNKFFETDPRMRLTTFVASFALLYLIVHGILTYVFPKAVLAGVVGICEVLLTIFYLSAFIAIAARYGPISCSNQFDEFNNNGSVSGCHSAKAAIAFAGLGFVLFAISTLIFGHNIIRRAYSKYSRNFGGWFQHTTNISSGKFLLNHPFLDFKEPYVDGTNVTTYSADVDQHTVGGDLETGNYNNNNHNSAGVAGAGVAGAGVAGVTGADVTTAGVTGAGVTTAGTGAGVTTAGTGAGVTTAGTGDYNTNAEGYNTNKPGNYQSPNEPPPSTTRGITEDSGSFPSGAPPTAVMDSSTGGYTTGRTGEYADAQEYTANYSNNYQPSGNTGGEYGSFNTGGVKDTMPEGNQP